MKALIVDDEAAAVIAVRLLVDWEKHDIEIVYEVNSSEDVLPLIQTEDIQIVISDVRMPGMNGLELIERVHQIRPLAQIIMMSGYGQFEYVRTALQQGCVDYIMKPIDGDQLNRAVEKAVAAWKKKIYVQNMEHSYNEVNNQMARKEAQRLLMLCMSLEDSRAEFERLREQMPALKTMKKYQIATIYVQHIPEDILIGDKEVSVLTDEVNDLVYPTGEALAGTRRVNSNIYIFLNADLKGKETLLHSIRHFLKKKTGIFFPISLGAPTDVDVPITEVRGLSRRLVREQPFRYWDELADGSRCTKTVDKIDLTEWEERLHKVILSGHEYRIRAEAVQLVEEIQKGRDLSVALVEQVLEDYIHMRIRWIEGIRLARTKDNGIGMMERPKMPTIVPYGENGEFSAELLREGLTEDIVELSVFFREIVGKKDRENIVFEEVEQYILMNYTQQLSVGQLAERFAVSENYLSRAFRKYIGMGIPEYINQLRIKRAKELMLNPALRISEVAYLVGYTDEKYFSRVFRKQEGVSPQTYRLEQH